MTATGINNYTLQVNKHKTSDRSPCIHEITANKTEIALRKMQKKNANYWKQSKCQNMRKEKTNIEKTRTNTLNHQVYS